MSAEILWRLEAQAYPSKVEVPLPSSSRTTKLSGVAWRRMDAVSAHSTRNVDSPVMMRSDAPSRVKIRSARVKQQAAAGTLHPTCDHHACRLGCSWECFRFHSLEPHGLCMMCGKNESRVRGACAYCLTNLLCNMNGCTVSCRIVNGESANAVCSRRRKDDTWARMTAMHVALEIVLLPAIFAPVKSSARAPEPSLSQATRPVRFAMTTGWTRAMKAQIQIVPFLCRLVQSHAGKHYQYWVPN